MKTITINVSEEVDREFRGLVDRELGVGKGKLGEAIEESLKLWIKLKKEEEISRRQLELLRRGFDFGEYEVDRDELHKRT